MYLQCTYVMTGDRSDPALLTKTPVEAHQSFVGVAVSGEDPTAKRLTFSKTAGGFGCFIFWCGTLQRGLISSKFFYISPLKIRPVKNNSRWKCKKAKASKISTCFFVSWSFDSSNYNEKVTNFFMARYYEPDSCLTPVLLMCSFTHCSGVILDL